MTYNPNIRPEYRGQDIVAIVRDRGTYTVTGTFEFGNPINVMPLLGGLPRHFGEPHAAKQILAPQSTNKTKFAATVLFAERLKSRIEIGGEDYEVLAMYIGVGPASAEPIARAVTELRSGDQVDLDKILR